MVLLGDIFFDDLIFFTRFDGLKALLDNVYEFIQYIYSNDLVDFKSKHI